MSEYRIIDARDVEDTSWMDAPDRRCIGIPQDVFFPKRGQSLAEARALCASCPYTRQCLEYALAYRITHGVWGNTSDRERRAMYRHKKVRKLCALISCGTPYLTATMNEHNFCSEACRQKHYLLYHRQNRGEWGDEEAS